MLYPAAARHLRSAIPEIVNSYQNALRVVRSPLALRRETWRTCHDQAVAIVEDCVAAMSGQKPSELAEARRYSHFVGNDRAKQGIAVAESVRAVEILWGAMQPAVRAALQRESMPKRAQALLLISNAFRASASSRLYAGALGYGTSGSRPSPETREGESDDDPAPTAAYTSLSEREREVLDGVARALTNDQIGRELGIKTATVKRHLNNIYGKLQAESRIDAVNKAFGRPAGPGRRPSDPPP